MAMVPYGSLLSPDCFIVLPLARAHELPAPMACQMTQSKVSCATISAACGQPHDALDSSNSLLALGSGRSWFCTVITRATYFQLPGCSSCLKPRSTDSGSPATLGCSNSLPTPAALRNSGSTPPRMD